MKQITRPPAQYVVARNTQFRLVPNDYDKNKYAQCNYTSHRTLIRCKQIRSKDALIKNSGRCEEHLEHSKMLEKNHRKEVMRCHAENDTKMQRRRFDSWVASNEFISDEDDYLKPMSDAFQGAPEVSNDNFLDSHPLRYAGTFTESDVLRIKMDLVKKDIEDLKEFKELLTAEAQKEHEAIGDDTEEDLPTDMVQRRLHKASSKYDRKDYLTLTTNDPIYKPCCVGPNMDDSQVISHILMNLLDNIDGKEEEVINVEEQCGKGALPFSFYCRQHIRLDRRQKLFDVCTECGATAIGGTDPKCSIHLKHCAQKEVAKACSCPKCVPPEKKNEKRVVKTEIEEDMLGNLSKFESMVSPMSQFSSSLLPSRHPSTSSSSSSNQRRYHGSPAQLLRPPQMGPPPGVTTHLSPIKTMRSPPMRSPPMTPQQIQEQQRIKAEEEEEKSKSCASTSRVRPVDPTQYGTGKKIPEIQQQQRQQYRSTGLTSNTSSSYHLHPKRTAGPSPGGPGSSKMTFQTWRNQGTSSTPRSLPKGLGGGGYPTNTPYPRPMPPKQMANMEEEKRLEGGGGGTSGGPEPGQRGLPYYKPAYRRGDPRGPLPPSSSTNPPHMMSSSTSGTSSQLLAPPSSIPQMYRPPQHQQRPMAPHRAIAAGLNPADVGGTARPVYRPQNPLNPSLPLPPHRHFPPGTMIGRRQPMNPRGPPARPLGFGVLNPGPGSGGMTSSGPSSSGGAAGGTGGDDFTAAGISAKQSLVSAREDSRFANINVKTFLSMGNQNFEKMTKEEIEKMAAASTASQEKQQKKITTISANLAAAGSSVPIGGGSSSAPGSSGPPPPSLAPHPPHRHLPSSHHHHPSPGSSHPPPPRGFGYLSRGNPLPKQVQKEIPDAVQQVVSTPSIKESERKREREKSQEMEEGGAPVMKKQAMGAGSNPEDKEKTDRPKTPKGPKKSPRGSTGKASTSNASSSSNAEENPAPLPPPPPPPPQGQTPLDLLAALSAEAEAEEEMAAPPPAPPAQQQKNVKKTPKKPSTSGSSPSKSTVSPSSSSASTVTQRRSSGRGKSEEKESK